MVIFWMFLFPIILMMLFHVVVKQAYEYTLDTISFHVVEHKKDEMFTLFLDELQKDGLFDISYTSYQEATNMLEEGKIYAIVEILADGTFQVSCKENGIEESMIVSMINMYEKQNAMIKQWMQEGKSYQEIIQWFHTKTLTLENTLSTSDQQIIYVLYFSAMTMACIYGGFYGIYSINDLQVNQSVRAKRLQIASMKKSYLMTIQILTNGIICILCNLLQVWIMIHVFQVYFQVNTIYVYMTTIVGSLLGVGIGMLIGIISNKKIDVKINILSIVTLFLCILSGMTSPDFKYQIHQNMPLLEYINPCALLADAYLRLSLYGIDFVYVKDIIGLIIFVFITYGITFYIVRRQSYANK